MNNLEFANKVFDYGFRVEKIFYLAGLSDYPPDDFVEFIENEDFSTLVNLFGECSEGIEKEINREDVQTWELIEYVKEWIQNNNKFGFIVQLATPIIGENGYSSWAKCIKKWFYVEDISYLFKVSEDWLEKN